MAHSFVCCHIHVVFSTKGRKNLIPANVQPRLWAYLGGIARDNDMKAIAVGGTDNHAHVLLSLSSTMPISKAVQLIKGGSSGWVHQTFPLCEGFEWQEGYGAFSVGRSMIAKTVEYIEDQRRHYQTTTFEEEFVAVPENPRHRLRSAICSWLV